MDVLKMKKEIMKLKKEKGIAILAHTYQAPDILDIADIKGDSFALSKAAAEIDAESVLVCGVRFMAETVKILSPEKKVILSHKDASCPMAEQILPKRVRDYKRENPHVLVCSYVNTTAALKAESDVCVTSSSAVKIVKALDAKDILFIPDKNLGAYVKARVPEKNIILWDGYCPVHNEVTAEDILEAKRKNPGAKVIMHPECPPEAAELADMLGSTASILDYAQSTDYDIILVTEKGVCDWLTREYPDRRFIQLAPEKLVCEDMKKTRLEDVYNVLNGIGGDIVEMDEQLRVSAKRSIENMLKYGG